MRTRRSPLVPFLALALVAVAAWAFLAPSLTYRRIQAAAEAGDARALGELVDFPALRLSVKDNVQTSVARTLSPDGTGVIAALGGMVAGKVVSPVVDAAVTPAGIAALTRGERPARDGKPRKSERRYDVDKGYEGPNRWAVRYRDPETGDESVALLLRREGLGWRMDAVRFGPDAK